MSHPIIKNLSLSPADVEALGEIRKVLETGKFLSFIVDIAPFALLLGASPVDAYVSIDQTDWEMFANAVGKVDIVGCGPMPKAGRREGY